MFEKLVELLSLESDVPEPVPDVTDHRLAAAALLVKAAEMDHVFDAAERERIVDLLCWRFELTPPNGEALLDRAERAAEDSHSMHGFSRAIRAHFSEEERIMLIELLWDIAYTDGELHPREASLLREIAGLLYVPDRESGAARKRVLARLGKGGR